MISTPTPATVLDNITWQPDLAAILTRLHLRPTHPQVAEVQRLLDEAEPLTRPMAVYQLAFVEERGSDYLVMGGTRFASRVLAVNLAGANRVFAYCATAGVELEAWQERQTDMLANYYAGEIAEQALRAATAHLEAHLRDVYALEAYARMNPGSLADWPLSQQRPLFSLIGDVEASIGVCLTESLLMVPRKSVSGIIFPSTETFASCQLCPREVCPNRRAAYDRSLYERKYHQARTQDRAVENQGPTRSEV